MPEIATNTATGTAVAGTAAVWMADLTMWLQFGITIGTLVSVVLSVWWHVLKIKDKRREKREREKVLSDGFTAHEERVAKRSIRKT